MVAGTVLEHIEREVQAERDRILREAHDTRDRIFSEAQAKVRAQAGELTQETDHRMTKEHHLVTNREELAKRQAVTQLKAALMERTLIEVKNQLASFAESEAYPDLFKQLLTEAVATLEAKSLFTICVRSQDADVAKKVLAQVAPSARIDATGHFLGGCEILAEEGQVHIVNTFESRLAQAHDLVMKTIADALFAEADG